MKASKEDMPLLVYPATLQKEDHIIKMMTSNVRTLAAMNITLQTVFGINGPQFK